MTYVSLYRRFRPQTFTEVMGQDHVTRTLRNAIAAGRTSHAYLFCGPRGTGKTTVAKVLAKALNCKDGPTPNPCDRCEACDRIRDGRSLDVIEIDAASNRGIDEIRDLREKVKFAPVEERYKVYIIDEVHMLTQEAFNALLKTLEEPPGHVVFVLATTEPHKVLPTILSRCQRFDFRRLTVTELSQQVLHVAEVEGIELSEDAVRLIATGAQGAARDALGLLEQCAAYAGGRITYDDAVAALGIAGFRKVAEFCDAVIQGDLAAALTMVRKLIDSGHDPALFLRDVLEHFRNLLVLKACEVDTSLIDAPEAVLADLRRQAEIVSETQVLQAIDILSDADAEMKYSASPELTTEIITIKLVYIESPSKVQARNVDRQASESQQIAKSLPSGSGSPSTRSPSTRSASTGSQSIDVPQAKSPSIESSQARTSPAQGGSSTEGVSQKIPTTEPSSTIGLSGESPAGKVLPAVSPAASSKPVQASIDDIKAGWDDVISALKPGIEKTLYYKDGIPVELNANELVISFHDDLRKELASDRRRRKSLQDAVEKVFGVKLAISFILAEEPSKIEFQLEPGDDLFVEKEASEEASQGNELTSQGSELRDTEYSHEIIGDIKDEDFAKSDQGSPNGDNGFRPEVDEEEVAESLRRTREAVREHPTVKAALSVFKGRVFKIDV